MKKLLSIFALLLCTLIASAEEQHFRIEVKDVTSFTATISVTPDDNRRLYVCQYATKADFDEFGVEYIPEFVKLNFDDLILEYMASGFEATYENFCDEGYGSTDITGLEPDADYVAFCYYINTETGMNDSPVELVEFHTTEVTPSENVITLTYNADKNVMHIETTNNDPYFFIVEKQSQYDVWQKDLSQESLTNEVSELISDMEAVGIGQYFYFKGSQDINLDEFYTDYLDPYVDKMPDGKWIALCAGYAGVVNSDVVYCQFRIGEEVVQKDERDVHFTDVEWVDNTWNMQWWEVSGYTADGKLGVIFSPVRASKVEGTYTTKDMYADYTHLYIPATEEYIYFEDITVVVSVNGSLIDIKADGLAQDGVLYHMTFDQINTDPDGIEEVSIETVAQSVRKMFKNGRITIIKDGKQYDADGRLMK